jgi:N-acetylglucosamine-6-phosphate deacetylase
MFDLQVNGYAGIDFNGAPPSPEDVHHACRCLKEDGVEAVLATVITDDAEAMAARLRALVAARESDPLARAMIAGFHIEGPFINESPGYVGAHPAAHVVPANPEAVKPLLEAAGGLAKIVTLAPERDPDMATTKALVAQGVTVSAGHCDPSDDELSAAVDAGLSMFTHLGNGCPMNLHRHDNIIQRVLARSDSLWIGFIPDGVHVPFTALNNYLRCAGVDRSFFVTDAISAARLGPGRYTLGSWELDIGEDLVARSPDGTHFVGSTVTWPRIQRDTAAALGLFDDELSALTSTNPKRAIGL